jgi:hypothetical protein
MTLAVFTAIIDKNNRKKYNGLRMLLSIHTDRYERRQKSESKDKID